MEGGGAGAGQHGGIHPLPVQRNGDAGGAPGAVNLTDFGVAGILHSKDRVPPQQLRQQEIQVFRAGADDDLLRGNRHAPEIPEVGGNGLPQGRQPLMGHRGQQRLRRLSQHLPGEPCPCGNGKPGGVHLIAAEIQQLGRRFRRPPENRFPGGRRRLLHVGHKETPSGQGQQIPLGLQLAVGTFHGDDGHPEMLRQRPLGGQPGSGRQHAAENIGADPAAEIFI